MIAKVLIDPTAAIAMAQANKLFFLFIEAQNMVQLQP